MNPAITELADQLHTLYKKLMATDPWDSGYGEVSAIHEYLLRVLRDKAQVDFAEFTRYLESSAKDIEQTWSSSKSALKSWDQWLRPVFERVETIISHTVPLLALLA
ncbi:MAG: hypothetical protein FD135_4810 [Comamonadaceae bacterium]|nr:MAG: hypothetical protein FD135_4810 [Comamonadaceae bacterium]